MVGEHPSGFEKDAHVPKHAHTLLCWSAANHRYELHEGGQITLMDAEAWQRWLEDHRSCAFQGRSGRLNLLRERRKAGPGYWYAYRRRNGRVMKRYAGRDSVLTWDHLEALAHALCAGDERAGSPDTLAAPDGVGPAPTAPILAPKLQAPRLHSSLLRRERLLARLDAGRMRKLTLLSAAAGAGKTTLVCQWLQHLTAMPNPPRIAWLALDEGDNDPLRFWRYVIMACHTFDPEVGAQSLALLETPITIKSPLEMALTTLLNELALLSRPSILVLEDYHVITAPQIHDAIGTMLAHLPSSLHLILMSRTHPPLPLARHAAAGEVTAIEGADLRFSDDETAAFIAQTTAHRVPPHEIGLVTSSLEGWAAGVRLLTLALERPSTGDMRTILAHFLADRRGIGAYFVSEVLQQQPPPLQQFILETSFLARLTASLCDSVTARTDSQSMLDTLDQANLFLEPLDGAGMWYRYHALFATAMQAEARRRLGGAAVRRVLERAGHWYEAHGLLSEAIEAAFDTHDDMRAADLIEQVARRQFTLEHPGPQSLPEFYTLYHWLVRLPAAIRNERPLLNMTLAFASTMQPHSDANDAEHLLTLAEQGFRAADDLGHLGLVDTFRALIARERGTIAVAVRWAKRALERLPSTAWNWRSMCMGTLAVGAYALGQLADADALFDAALALSAQVGNRQFVRAASVARGWCALEQNEQPRAAGLFHQTLADARVMGDLEDTALALHGLAEMAWYANDLDTAWALATEVVEATRQSPHQPAAAHAECILARVEHARGQSAAALARCAALLHGRAWVAQPTEQQLAAQIAYEQAHITLATGDLAAVRRWRDTRPTDLELPRMHQDREALLLARLRMAEDDPEAAAQTLVPLLAAAERDGRERVALELRVLLARARAATGQQQDARHLLTAALASAYRANAQQVLIAEGEALAPVLRTTLPAIQDQRLRAFAKTLLRQLTPAPERATIALLSPQERRVLRLIAAGQSNTVIALDLVVSINTVKVHVKNIYRKLGVASRLEAVRAAHDLDILSQ